MAHYSRALGRWVSRDRPSGLGGDPDPYSSLPVHQRHLTRQTLPNGIVVETIGTDPKATQAVSSADGTDRPGVPVEAPEEEARALVDVLRATAHRAIRRSVFTVD